ncbi:MAG TPA: class I tRNA ligase family protein, partial [Bacteroidales bacterium]|nr:class I tRNA ligase family protein [Bacteroidales bacterium]
WNAFRLTQTWTVDTITEQPQTARAAILWFEATLDQTINMINDHFDKFRIADALLSIYKLIWDDFCSWYLEMVKPAYLQPIDSRTMKATIDFFDQLLRLLHPFMPFISEEIFQRLRNTAGPESIMIAQFPTAGPFDKNVISDFEFAKQVIIAIRNFRQKKNVSVKETLELYIRKNNRKINTWFDPIIAKLCNLAHIAYVEEKPEKVITILIETTEFYLPATDHCDFESEIEKLEADLKYQKDFMEAIEKKLSNEKFMSSAPKQVVEKERKKQADALARINIIESQLQNLRKD